MTDLAGAGEPAHARDDVVAGPAGRLVDDDDAVRRGRARGSAARRAVRRRVTRCAARRCSSCDALHERVQAGVLAAVRGRVDREEHVDEHALRDEHAGGRRRRRRSAPGTAGRPPPACAARSRPTSSSAPAMNPCMIRRSRSRSVEQADVRVAHLRDPRPARPGPRRASPRSAALASRVRLEEELALGAEQPHDVRLRDAGRAGHLVRARRVPALGEHRAGRDEDLGAALGAGHALRRLLRRPARRAAPETWLTCYQPMPTVALVSNQSMPTSETSRDHHDLPAPAELRRSRHRPAAPPGHRRRPRRRVRPDVHGHPRQPRHDHRAARPAHRAVRHARAAPVDGERLHAQLRHADDRRRDARRPAGSPPGVRRRHRRVRARLDRVRPGHERRDAHRRPRASRAPAPRRSCRCP